MPNTAQEFLETAAPWIAGFLALAAALNLARAWRAVRRRRPLRAGLWLASAVAFGCARLRGPGRASRRHARGRSSRPSTAVLGPVTFSLRLAGRRGGALCWGGGGSCVPAVAWAVLDAVAAVDGPLAGRPGLRGHRRQARQLAHRGHGIPAGFFHLAGYRPGGRNDDRLARGLPPVEKDYADTVLVWPDVVYLELIGMRRGHGRCWWSGRCVVRGTVGAAGQSGAHAQPVQGPVVLPGLAGNAGVFSALDGRRDAAGC